VVVSSRVGWTLGCLHGVVDGASPRCEPPAQRARSESRGLGTDGNVVWYCDHVRLAGVASPTSVRNCRVARRHVSGWVGPSQETPYRHYRSQFLIASLLRVVDKSRFHSKSPSRITAVAEHCSLAEYFHFLPVALFDVDVHVLDGVRPLFVVHGAGG